MISLKEVIDFSNNFSKTRHMIRAYLRDIAPEEEIRTINILLNVYESGIAKELFEAEKLLSNQYRIYIKRLEQDYGMSTEAAIEALNQWADVCIRKGAGTRFGNTILKGMDKRKEANNVEPPKEKLAISLGVNDVIFEDSSLRITFVKWKRIHYINTGDARIATFMFENRTNKKLSIFMENVSIAGFLNQEKTISYELPATQKGIKDFNLVYEDKVPGNTNDFKTVEFQISYGKVREGYTSLIEGPTETSGLISLNL